MKYDFDTVLSRTGTGCIKWDKPFACSDEQTVLSLWVADMDFPCSTEIQEALHRRVEEQIYGYSCGFDDAYRNSVTGWFQRRFQWTIAADSIFYAGGVVPAIAYLLEILSEEGDSILIQPPVYYPFRNKILATRRCVVESPLCNTDGVYTIDFADLEEKLAADEVKGMILCSPHNPVGRVWSKEELQQVADLAHTYGKWIISDEIHCDLIREGIHHIPLHTLVPEYKDEIIVCTAPSKSFNLAGLQNSNIIITKPEYQQRWKEFVGNRLSLNSCNSFALAATKAAYNESEDWLNQVNSYIDQNIRYACDYLVKELPQAVVSPCEGTYLLWVDVRAYCPDERQLEKRMRQQSLILDEGYLFGAFIGGVMLAAVTSLPELFTSLTAVLALDQPDLVQGNVLGSNIFNLCVIGGLMLFTSRRYQRATLSKSHSKTLWFGLVMYALVFAAIMMPKEVGFSFLKVNLMSILILLVYAVNVKFMGNDDSGDVEEEVYISLSVRQIAVRFICYSVGLVIVSILLTTVTDRLAEELQLGATVAGAIFLGVATSLPELSASVNLVRIGNFNASFGNIVGSNLFNFIILCFADVLFTQGSIYVNEPQVMNLLGFGAFSMVCTLVVIYGKKHRALVLLASVAILGSYVTSILLSM